MKKLLILACAIIMAAMPTEAQVRASAKKGNVTLQQCPHQQKGLRVDLRKDGSQAVAVTVYYNGENIQTIADNDGLCTDWYDTPAQEMVWFVDANFDGWLDIFIGNGTSRTYSTLLLWNPSSKSYWRIGELGDPTWQNPVFNYTDKAVFTGGSYSASGYFYSKAVWKGEKLVTVETLDINTDKTSSPYQFTVSDANGKTIVQTNNMKQLPQSWLRVMR